MTRSFRFGVIGGEATSGAEWAERARRAEALGYAVLAVPDHYLNPITPVPALMAAAAATTTLRVTCTVFANDFRHPALLAKEAATIDLLSDGRFELGIGAGWLKDEYDRAGIPFDPPGVRVSRMEEGLAVIKGLWGAEPFSFVGAHYTIADLDGTPKPVQRPHPPVFIGGGGKRLLSFAAREADIVGFLSLARPGGGIDWSEGNEQALARKVDWVREAAGARLSALEFAILFQQLVVTDRPREAAEETARANGMTVEQAMASTEFVFGSVEQHVERLLMLRERYGITYATVTASAMEAFAPIVARLAGT